MNFTDFARKGRQEPVGNWSSRAEPPRFDRDKPASLPATSGARGRGASQEGSTSSEGEGAGKKASSQHLQLDLSQVDAGKPSALLSVLPAGLPGLDARKKKFAGGGRLRTLVMG